MTVDDIKTSAMAEVEEDTKTRLSLLFPTMSIAVKHVCVLTKSNVNAIK